MTSGWPIKLTIRISPRHLGQRRGSVHLSFPPLDFHNPPGVPRLTLEPQEQLLSTNPTVSIVEQTPALVGQASSHYFEVWMHFP